MALSTSLISYYKLDESSGVADDAIENNDGTVSGAVTRDVTGKIGKAYNFTNSDGMVAIADGGDFSRNPGTQNFSVQAWIKLTSAGASWDSVFMDRNTANSSLAFYIRTSTSPCKLSCGGAGGDGGWRIDGDTTLSSATWYHVVLVVDGTTAKVYLNGSEDGSDVGFTAYTASGSGSTIGRWRGSGWEHPMYGVIDEVAYWSRALTTTEITTLYNSGSGLAYPFGVDKTVEPSTQTLSLSGETSKAIVLDSPLSLSTSLTGLAPVPAITIFPSTLELTSVGNVPPILQEPDTLILKLIFQTPSLNILNNTWRNPNYGTKSTKIISNLDIPDGIGGVMNLLPQDYPQDYSNVLSKKRVGLGM